MNIQLLHERSVLTRNSLFDGLVSCYQYRNGYRFSVDAVLAAQFVAPAQGESILDLGAGCGVISLIMMYRWGERIRHIRGVEIQEQLVSLANTNFKVNDYQKKCHCVQGDAGRILDFFAPESFSMTVSNPPFYPDNSGRKSLNEQARVARHQISADIYQLTKGAAAVLQNHGNAVFIYPAERFSELSEALASARLEVKTVRFVYSYPDQSANARLVLVRALKNGGRGVDILPPLYIYQQKGGEYSRTMQQLYAPVRP